MKKAAGVVGLILVAVFLVLGFTSTTPDKYIKSYGDDKMYEYVGGDAYNYIIEVNTPGGISEKQIGGVCVNGNIRFLGSFDTVSK